MRNLIGASGKALLLIATVVMVGCGGGGSSSGSGKAFSSNNTSSSSSSSSTASVLSLAVERTNLTLNENGSYIHSEFIEAQGHNIDGDVYFVVDATQAPMLSFVDIASLDVDTQAGLIELEYIPSNQSVVGTHFGVVNIDVCRDSACNSKYQDTPVTLEVVYTVLPDTSGDPACTDAPGTIYADCVDSSWMGPYGWQLDYATGRYYNYFDNDGTLLVEWDEVELGDEHGRVIDVKYTDDRARGQINFAPPRLNGDQLKYDLSSFAGGSLDFDIRVLNPGVNNRPLYLGVECGWPCGTGRIPLNLEPGSDWQSFSFSVADLVARGLNLSNIEAGFIVTTDDESSNSEPLSSQGLHFQLDNIRWVGGEEAVAGDPDELTVKPVASGLSVPLLSDITPVYTVEYSIPGGGESFYQVDTSWAPFIVHSYPSSADDNTIYLDPESPLQIGAGTYTGDVLLHVCHDSLCSEPYPNSPVTISLVYTVIPTSNSSMSCTNDPGEMFIDCVSTAWLDLSAWERRKIGTTDVYYRTFNGDGTFALRWELLQVDDGDHGYVIDVQHNQDPLSTDRLQFLAAGENAPDASIDFSEYADGTLEFDVKVLDWGDSAGFLELELSCGPSCRMIPKRIDTAELDQWVHYSYDISGFVAEGLDLSKIDIGFSIAPPHFSSAGAHYQIDNVRWVK